MLRIATPLAVPLVSSSNFDCSHVRVPSANAVETGPEPLKPLIRRLVRRTRKSFRALCNFIPRSDVGGGIFRLSRRLVAGRRPRPGGLGRSLILRGIVRFHAFLAPGPAALARLQVFPLGRVQALS